MSDEYQPRTRERLIEILQALGHTPRSWQTEAAAMLRKDALPPPEPTEGQKAFCNFMAQLIVAENGASLNGNVTIREQPMPASVYDAALRASLSLQDRSK